MHNVKSMTIECMRKSELSRKNYEDNMNLDLKSLAFYEDLTLDKRKQRLNSMHVERLGSIYMSYLFVYLLLYLLTSCMFLLMCSS